MGLFVNVVKAIWRTINRLGFQATVVCGVNLIPSFNIKVLKYTRKAVLTAAGFFNTRATKGNQPNEASHSQISSDAQKIDKMLQMSIYYRKHVKSHRKLHSLRRYDPVQVRRVCSQPRRRLLPQCAQVQTPFLEAMNLDENPRGRRTHAKGTPGKFRKQLAKKTP